MCSRDQIILLFYYLRSYYFSTIVLSLVIQIYFKLEIPMKEPTLLTTSVQNEAFAGVTYHLQGELVPVLVVELDGKQSIYFEHHILLWKNPSITINIKAIPGALKRMIAGMQIFITQASGSGAIGFSRDGAGHIVPLHLRQGDEIHVREHQFLAATGNVDYTFELVKGMGTMLFGGTGFFVDKFQCVQGEGILWLHGYGNVFEIVLDANEQIDIEPGGWLYKDKTVRMETKIQNISTGLFASMNLVMNRFTRPGRVGIQSMYVHMPSAT